MQKTLNFLASLVIWVFAFLYVAWIIDMVSTRFFEKSFKGLVSEIPVIGLVSNAIPPLPAAISTYAPTEKAIPGACLELPEVSLRNLDLGDIPAGKCLDAQQVERVFRKIPYIL